MSVLDSIHTSFVERFPVFPIRWKISEFYSCRPFLRVDMRFFAMGGARGAVHPQSHVKLKEAALPGIIF